MQCNLALLTSLTYLIDRVGGQAVPRPRRIRTRVVGVTEVRRHAGRRFGLATTAILTMTTMTALTYMTAVGREKVPVLYVVVDVGEFGRLALKRKKIVIKKYENKTKARDRDKDHERR